MSKRDVLAQDERDSQERAVYKAIGERIQVLMRSPHNRKKRRLTQEDLAQAITEKTGVSISRTSIAKWISGTRRPSIQDILILCDLFDCSFEYLCGWKTKKRDYEVAERYTGLSQEAVRYLHNLPEEYLLVLDELLSDDSGFSQLLDSLLTAIVSQNHIDELEAACDEIENRVEEILHKGPLTPESIKTSPENSSIYWSAYYKSFAPIEVNELEQHIESLRSYALAIDRDSSLKDVCIRRFYYTLEKLVPDAHAHRWTFDYLQNLYERVDEYLNHAL